MHRSFETFSKAGSSLHSNSYRTKNIGNILNTEIIMLNLRSLILPSVLALLFPACAAILAEPVRPPTFNPTNTYVPPVAGISFTQSAVPLSNRSNPNQLRDLFIP